MSRSKLIYNRLMSCVHNGEVDNEELVAIVKDIFLILGLKNLTSYAKSEKVSYQAARKRKLKYITIDTEKFIIDND